MKLDNYLILENESRIRKLKIHEIIYLQYENYTVQIFMNGDNSIFCSKTLKFFEEKLCDHGFFRVDKNTLINMHFIKEYIKTDRLIKLIDNRGFTVPIKKIKDFTNCYRNLNDL